ncbi:MAG: zf-TFIIB domain-containing protein [Anaerolineae bacterium]|jgi:hypothetical protein|nr:zf-TFIIB domain-containing protein [Anaerolineae bacterium]
MKCPVCNVDLRISDKHGVEIDYCPQCRGIWLDRGELEKIMQKSINDESQRFNDYSRDEYKRKNEYPPMEEPRYEDRRRYEDDRRRYDEDDTDHRRRGHDDDHYKRNRKKSILEDIFDIF